MLDGAPDIHDRTVASTFPKGGRAKLALIGEAPGEREVERGLPFCGPSGSVLDAMLRAAGIDRADCYVGNVYDTKLRDNKVSEHRAALGAEAWELFHSRNAERLYADLSSLGCNVVVPLGATALLALAGTPSIAQFRGSVRMGLGQFAGFKLVPTFHPAMVLRQWSNYTICIGDLIRAAKQAELGPGIVWPKRELNITPSIEEVEQYLAGPCRQTDLLSVDIETGWGQVRGVSFAPSQFEALYVPFIALNKLDRNYWPDAATEKKAWLAVRDCLQSPTPKLGQNFANYDVIWLLGKMGIKVNGLGDDLRLLHKALYPELPASLAFMGSAYSEQGSWKTMARHSGRRVKDDDKRDS